MCKYVELVYCVCMCVCACMLGSQPEEPLMNLWKTQWPLHEFKVSKAAAEESIGIYHKLVSCDNRICADCQNITSLFTSVVWVYLALYISCYICMYK